MKEYIIRISRNGRAFKEIFIEAENNEDAIQKLDKEHRRSIEDLDKVANVTSNLYEINWIEGI